jgi:hypothetical protein
MGSSHNSGQMAHIDCRFFIARTPAFAQPVEHHISLHRDKRSRPNRRASEAIFPQKSRTGSPLRIDQLSDSVRDE